MNEEKLKKTIEKAVEIGQSKEGEMTLVHLLPIFGVLFNFAASLILLVVYFLHKWAFWGLLTSTIASIMFCIGFWLVEKYSPRK